MRMITIYNKPFFDPLKLRDTTLFACVDSKSRLAKMNYRSADGHLQEGHHFMQSSLNVYTQEDIDNAFHNGAGGCFATAEDFCGKPFPSFPESHSMTTVVILLQRFPQLF
jgi:hypothetical protein